MNLRIAVGVSAKKEIRGAVLETLLDCHKKLPPAEADLALVFSSAGMANTNLLKNIKQALKPSTPLIGCSGNSLITPKGILNEGLCIVLISCPEAKLSCGMVNHIKNKGAFSSGEEFGAFLLSPARGFHREFCLLFTDGMLADISGFLKGLQSILGKSFPFIGGSAASNPGFKQSFQYYNTEVMDNGSSAVLFSGKINYILKTAHGWKPLGKVRAITDCSSNIIKTIDGEKAVQLYEGYFAKNLRELRKEISRINIFYPLGIYQAGEKEYILRNIVSFNDDGSITASAEIPQESKIRLMIGTKESCLEAAKSAAEQIHSDARDKKIDLCLIFSSSSRAKLLGRRAKEEIKIIQEKLGAETPIAGFYGYGEQAPMRSAHYYGQSYHHNQAITILGLSA